MASWIVGTSESKELCEEVGGSYGEYNDIEKCYIPNDVIDDVYGVGGCRHYWHGKVISQKDKWKTIRRIG